MSRRSFLCSVLAVAITAFQAKPTFAAAKVRRGGHPQVYLLRGLANIFSTGLDEIGKKLRAAGVDAHVEGFTAWRSALNKIVADRQKFGPSPVILVGHSLGANAIVSLAQALEKHGIVVDYMATFAATSPSPLPPNIKRAVSFYFSSHSWGVALTKGPGFRGRLEKRDLSRDPHVNHFNIEKQAPLQDEVVSGILHALR
ncbi:lipase [Rhizobium sp. Root73]|uniref:alpha/beta fold hydrolase n=1 Tax=unclassified Rhizobium TaxID=2613769 RepID=UPI00072BF50B|nr:MULTISPECIES: lipase [unclassified Rhizobium]KQY16876.1 lipase [Rhizobium sp. Root1334]KRC11436.1 lipase [Rhizobium sp. Root73]